MKIGFVFDDGLDSPDGVQQYILTLGNWLVNQGHEVHYLVGETKKIDSNIQSLGKNIKVSFNHNKLTIPLPVSKNKIKVLLDSEKFDVLHVQMPYSPQFAARVINLTPTGTAIVGTFHILPLGLAPRLGTHVLKIIEKKSLEKLDIVMAVSDAAAEFAKQSLGLSCQVIPNAVNLNNFKSGKPLAEYSKTQNVVFLGRLVKRKGAFELIKAVQILIKNKDFTNRQLLIGGSGPEEKKLKAYVEKNGLSSYILFIGQQPEKDKANLLATGDVVALPSLGGESFGIIVVESIASGASVTLGGNNPGYKFVLADTLEALVDPKDTELFAQKLKQLLDDRQLRKLLSERQQQRIKQFDVNNIGPRVLEVYTQAISNHAKV